MFRSDLDLTFSVVLVGLLWHAVSYGCDLRWACCLSPGLLVWWDWLGLELDVGGLRVICYGVVVCFVCFVLG